MSGSLQSPPSIEAQQPPQQYSSSHVLLELVSATRADSPVNIHTHTESFCGRLIRVAKTSGGTTLAVTLNTGIFIVLLSIGNGVQHTPGSTAYMSNFQVIGVVPHITRIFAISAEISLARGAGVDATEMNSIIIAGRRVATQTTLPQFISLAVALGLTWVMPERAASSTRKFLIPYALGIWFNNRIIANQETFMANNDITKLNIHNLIYFALAVGSFVLLNQCDSLNSWSIGLAFTLSEILTCLMGEIQFCKDRKYQNSIFDYYQYKPKLTNTYQAKINQTGWGIFFQYGFQNYAYAILILAASINDVAADATGPLAQLFSIFTVIPQQVTQALVAEFIGSEFGKHLEKFKLALKDSPSAHLNANTEVRLLFKNFVISGAAVISLESIFLTFGYFGLSSITKIMIPGESETETLALAMVENCFKYVAIGGLFATLTEFLNATSRKTKQNKPYDGWVQGGITSCIATISAILILNKNLDYEGVWILFMLATILKFSYQSIQTYMRGFDPLTQARQEYKQEAQELKAQLVKAKAAEQKCTSPQAPLSEDTALTERLDFSTDDPHASTEAQRSAPHLSLSSAATPILSAKSDNSDDEADPDEEAKTSPKLNRPPTRPLTRTAILRLSPGLSPSRDFNPIPSDSPDQAHLNQNNDDKPKMYHGCCSRAQWKVLSYFGW